MDNAEVIYKSMISSELQKDILNYFMSIESNLNSVSGSSIFPLRKQIRELPLK